MDLCCFGTQALDWIEARNGLAAWLQALGAIVGIGIAIWAGGAPARHELRMARAKREDFLTAISDAARFTMESHRSVGDAIAQERWFEAMASLGVLKQVNTGAILKKALREPLSTWPSATLFVCVQNYVFCMASLAAMDKAPPTDESGWNTHLLLIRSRYEAVAMSKERLDDEIARLRAVG